MKNPFTIQHKKGFKEGLVVGANLPRQLAEDLSLYCLSVGISKSEAIREAVADYVEERLEQVEKAMDILTERALIEWESRKRDGDGKRYWQLDNAFKFYKHELVRALVVRGIRPSMAKRIVAKVKK